ncbi:MAG: hypothetical protein QOE46_2 [Acidobacteriota bacterium]|jgi:CheY-like chemotaxis protein|nr:hypothetical protein [Acidobacteriota bacterium]
MTDKVEPLVQLLWADDDSTDALEALADYLDDANFQLERAVDYQSAINKLEENGGIQSLLLDVILPKARGSGSLAYDLGITLADRAAERGVKSIVFLTVVRRSEVVDKYNELVSKYPDVEFSYFDKTRLLEKHVLENMFHCLRTTKSGVPEARND